MRLYNIASRLCGVLQYEKGARLENILIFFKMVFDCQMIVKATQSLAKVRC